MEHTEALAVLLREPLNEEHVLSLITAKIIFIALITHALSAALSAALIKGFVVVIDVFLSCLQYSTSYVA
jgi:hypothetical protein